MTEVGMQRKEAGDTSFQMWSLTNNVLWILKIENKGLIAKETMVWTAPYMCVYTKCVSVVNSVTF